MPWTLRMTLLITCLTVISMIYNTARIYWYSRQTALYSFHYFWAIFGGAGVMIFAYPFTGWLMHTTGGTFSREWYPIWMIMTFWYGFIFNTVLLSWILAIDVMNFFITYVIRIKRPQVQTLTGLGVIVLSMFVFLYTSVKTIYDTNRIKIEQIVFDHSADISGNSVSLKIVHLSEMHADRYTSQKKLNRYMRKVDEQEPDIIFFTGDLISSGMDYVEAAAKALSSVDTSLGIYFVMGDHDYWSGPDQITEILEKHGIQVIRDANQWIETGEHTVKITGVTEVYSTSIDRDLLRELLNERRDEKLSIVFSHQAPDDLIGMAREAGTDILLAGHTHGGQIRIPVFFKKLTAASMETDYVIGHWWFDEMLLNINSGLGFTLSPLRYNAPAEVSVIEVR